MAVPVEMPKLGNTVEECLLARWLKRPGESVSSGEVIAEIETDKATFELAAPAAGTMLEVFFGEGELVPVFTNICVIGEPGESADAFKPCAAPGPQAAPPASAAAPSPAPAAARAAPAQAPPGEPRLTPRARRFAAEHGFFPRGITGSGPGGRVLERDLRALYQQAPRVTSLAREHLAAGYEVRGPGSGLAGMVRARDLGGPPVRLSPIRERIARRMRESLALSAQYTLNTSADATGLLRLRARIKAARESRDLPDINLNDLVMFAAVRALAEMPELNAELIDGQLYQHAEIHLGFACDTPRGLLVPVVRNCQKLSLAELSLEVKRLAQAAAEGTISPDDLAGGTFTVSNMGSLGIESFTPILNPPQVALLGVNAIGLKPVRQESGVVFVEHIGLSLTCDHQVIDGAVGARFLRLLATKIEGLESLCGLEIGDAGCTT